MMRGLIIFAREPVPGRAKTRLAAAIGDQASAAISGAMLDDVLANTARLEGVRRLLFWAANGDELPDHPSAGACEQFGQSCGDLGERMEDAFRRAFALNITTCCIVGSDLPDLPMEHVEEAFRVLEEDRSDVVFGPAADGGYYLLGMRRLWPDLFQGIAWSTSSVLQQSLGRAKTCGARVVLLPEWHDVDTLDDLGRLALHPGEAIITRRLLDQLPSIHHLLTGGGQ